MPVRLNPKLPATAEHAALPESAYYSGTAETQDVLAGCVRDMRQLCACLACRFYHIPAAQLQFHLPPTSHIALYLPSFSPETPAGIRYLGRVIRMTLVRRSEIDALPKASDTPYYCFEIDEWRPLTSAVTYRRMRAAPYFYTSRFLLEHCMFKGMPLLDGEDEFLLFSQLQHLAGQACGTQRQGFYCGRRMVICDGTLLTVAEGRQILACFSLRAFFHAPYTVFRRICALLVQ